MTKSEPSLSATQQLIVAASHQRRDRMVLPLPAEVHARGAARQRMLAALLARNVVEEVPTKKPALAWRQDDQGKHVALRVIAKAAAAADPGRAAAAQQTEPGPADALSAPEPSSDHSVPALATGSAGPGGKLRRVLLVLGGPGGATLQELVTLTGWLPHTTRAAITRLKQRGYPVQLVKAADRKAYRLVQASGT